MAYGVPCSSVSLPEYEQTRPSVNAPARSRTEARPHWGPLTRGLDRSIVDVMRTRNSVLVLAGFSVGCSPIPAPQQEDQSGSFASVSSNDGLQQLMNKLSTQEPTRVDSRASTWIDVPEPTWIDVVQVGRERDGQPRHEPAPLPWKRWGHEPVVILGNLHWVPVTQYGAIANWGTRNEQR